MNRGKDDSTLRFLQADKIAETRARLVLVAATAVVICSGLKVLGVTPVGRCAEIVRASLRPHANLPRRPLAWDGPGHAPSGADAAVLGGAFWPWWGPGRWSGIVTTAPTYALARTTCP